jgi:hypothetical protein
MSFDNRSSNSARSADISSASACRINGSKSPDLSASDNLMRSINNLPHDHIIDPGIARAVTALQAAGVETFESCQGGAGHAFNEPTVRFHGGQAEGFRALAAAAAAGLTIDALRRVWIIIDGEPTGPSWELTRVE